MLSTPATAMQSPGPNRNFPAKQPDFSESHRRLAAV
jgi:hypothetical protein